MDVVTWDDWQLPYQGGQLISFSWLVEGFRVLDKQLWNCSFVLSFLAMQTWAACCGRRRQWVLDGWWTKIFWRLWVIKLHFARHHHETEESKSQSSSRIQRLSRICSGMSFIMSSEWTLLHTLHPLLIRTFQSQARVMKGTACFSRLFHRLMTMISNPAL